MRERVTILEGLRIARGQRNARFRAGVGMKLRQLDRRFLEHGRRYIDFLWVELARLLAEITPGKLEKTFRANGGRNIKFAAGNHCSVAPFVGLSARSVNE